MKPGNKYAKEKKAKLIKTCFFSKKSYFQSHKIHLITKENNYTYLFILPREVLETCIYPEYVCGLQEERQIRQKIKKKITFFVTNPCRSQ